MIPIVLCSFELFSKLIHKVSELPNLNSFSFNLKFRLLDMYIATPPAADLLLR